MLMHLLVHKSGQNNSLKDELDSSLYVALEGAHRFSFREHLKLHKKGEEKDIIDVLIDGLLDNAIESALEGASKDALNDIRKDTQEAKLNFESKQNVVQISIFQLLLIMFNLSAMQAISR